MKVFLTGGLGNQIFQVCAALSLYKGEIEIVTTLGNPRTTSDGKPEIQSLTLPNRVVFRSPPKYFRSFSSKILGFNLRAHAHTRRYEYLFLPLIRLLGSLLLSIFFMEKIVLEVSKDVGYSRLNPISKRSFLVGYFQSYKYLEMSSEELLKNLKVKNQTKEFLELFNKMRQTKNLVLHVRLGDYLNEPNFGILSANYYLTALQHMDTDEFEKIYVFTDSPMSVQDFLPERIRSKFELAPNSLSSSETLLLMTLGNQYVIGNSTFSWWGATLSATPNKKIIAPKPWFLEMKEPIDLIHPTWIRISR